MHGWARRWGTARLVAAVVVVAVLAAGCGGEEEEMSSFTLPRTYEQLDLGDPAAAVAEFTSAFLRRDYLTAMLIFHPATQSSMAIDVGNADFTTWVTRDVEAAVTARIEIERGGDHRLDAMRVFEVAMEEATLNGGFRVDLAGGVSDIAIRSADGFTAVVDATLSSSQEAVVFELAPTPDGRWRVRQVRHSNGNGLELPFSGRPTLGSPDRALDITTTWRAGLPNTTPTELMTTVAALVEAGDFVSVYLLLDAPAQREVDALLAAGGTPDHHVTASALDATLDEAGFAIDLSLIEFTAEPSEASGAAAGDSFTFMVADGGAGLDVTITLDSTAGWRLHRLAVVGDLASPVPFPVS